MESDNKPVVTPAGAPMEPKIEKQAELTPEDSQAVWLARVNEKAAAYRKAQNEAQDASEALHGAMEAAKAAGVDEALILSVVTV
jgi:hypothetical protein